MKLFKTYKHQQNSDVAAYLAIEVGDYGDSVSFIVYWVNISGQKHFIFSQDLINIKKSDFSQWEEIEVNFHGK